MVRNQLPIFYINSLFAAAEMAIAAHHFELKQSSNDETVHRQAGRGQSQDATVPIEVSRQSVVACRLVNFTSGSRGKYLPLDTDSSGPSCSRMSEELLVDGKECVGSGGGWWRVRWWCRRMREDGFRNPSCPSEFDRTCRLKLKLNYCYIRYCSSK